MILQDLGVRQLARILGRSPSLVSRYKARGMPCHTPDAARAWMAAHVRADARTAMRQDDDPELRASYRDSRARREMAEAALAERHLQELRAALTNPEAIRQAHTRRLEALRAALIGMAERLAPALAASDDQATCHNLLQQEVTAVLVMAARGELPAC